MQYMKGLPPLAPLGVVFERLHRSHVVAALGGSGLLAALGLADSVRDWDITTDAEPDRVTAALAGEPLEHHGPDALHADQKLVLSGGAIEVIMRFAFHTERGVVRIPTVVAGHWEGIPLGSAEAWAVAYHLMGRRAKAEALWRLLATRGADPAVVERLTEEPLSPDLAARLRLLPTSSVT